MSSDFGPEWESIQSLDEGGQGHIYTALRVGDSAGRRYVIKRLKNLKRFERFGREIETIKRLSHPNVLGIVADGIDKKGYPFLVTEFFEAGSLADSNPTEWTEIEKLTFFEQVCSAVTYAHSHGVIHRDIKPENIFLSKRGAVLGDFGICYAEDDDTLTMTADVMGSRYYCAPELRDGRIHPETPKELADIYSLGKLLYWIFAKRTFDREETSAENALAFALAGGDTFVRPVQAMIAAAVVDQLVGESVVADPSKRLIRVAKQFNAKVARAIDRVKTFGRPLDLRLPKRCLFCGEGEYKPSYEGREPPYGLGPTFPQLEVRQQPTRQSTVPGQQRDPFDSLRSAERRFLGDGHGAGIPLNLVCTHCGNVQYFRFDMTAKQHGENWKP